MHKKYNGIQARLIKFENPNNIQTFNTDVHLDLVASAVELKFWPDFDIDFNKTNRVTHPHLFLIVMIYKEC